MELHGRFASQRRLMISFGKVHSPSLVVTSAFKDTENSPNWRWTLLIQSWSVALEISPSSVRYCFKMREFYVILKCMYIYI